MHHQERVDLLNDDGKPLGRSEFRNIAHSKGLWHRTVHIWIRNLRGELLLQQRSVKKETFPGLWDISAAGHITAGDSSIFAAVREVHEELGISIIGSNLKHLFTIRHEYVSPDSNFKDREFSDVYLLASPIEEHQISPDPEEVSGVAFFEINRLKNMLVTMPEMFVPHEEEFRWLFGVVDF